MYDDAWYRIQNETTSQTLDYSKIKKVPLPEGLDEPADDEETVKEVIYLAGRVYCELNKQGQQVWIYERWNKTVTSDKYPDIAATLAEIYAAAVQEVNEYEAQI